MSELGTGWMSGACGGWVDHRRNTAGGANLGLYGGHEPLRNIWDCAACGQPWPCDPVRIRMIDSLTPRTCGQIMTGMACEAAGDLGLDSAEIFDRFLLWIYLLPADRTVNELPARR